MANFEKGFFRLYTPRNKKKIKTDVEFKEALWLSKGKAPKIRVRTGNEILMLINISKYHRQRYYQRIFKPEPKRKQTLCLKEYKRIINRPKP